MISVSRVYAIFYELESLFCRRTVEIAGNRFTIGRNIFAARGISERIEQISGSFAARTELHIHRSLSAVFELLTNRFKLLESPAVSLVAFDFGIGYSRRI